MKTSDDDLRTGDEWNNSGEFKFRVLDCDGWDRSTRSFFEEKISREEFSSRAMRSTCVWRAL